MHYVYMSSHAPFFNPPISVAAAYALPKPRAMRSSIADSYGDDRLTSLIPYYLFLSNEKISRYDILVILPSPSVGIRGYYAVPWLSEGFAS